MTWAVAHRIEKERVSNQCDLFDPLFGYTIYMVCSNTAIGYALIAFSDIMNTIISKVTVVISVCFDSDDAIGCMSFKGSLSK